MEERYDAAEKLYKGKKIICGKGSERGENSVLIVLGAVNVGTAWSDEA